MNTLHDAHVQASVMNRARENASFIPEEWVSMTQATECLWGTSGRGNPNCVKIIEICARLGLIEIKQRDARTRIVRRVVEVETPPPL